MNCPWCGLPVDQYDYIRSVVPAFQRAWVEPPKRKPRVRLHCEETPAGPEGFRWWITTEDGLETMHVNYSGMLVNSALGST